VDSRERKRRGGGGARGAQEEKRWRWREIGPARRKAAVERRRSRRREVAVERVGPSERGSGGGERATQREEKSW
jgi:hypothetical protein